MTARRLVLCVLWAAYACDGGSATSPGNLGSDDPSSISDAGEQAPELDEQDAGPGDGIDEPDDVDGAADAGAPVLPPADAGPADPIRDIIDTVAEFTTCKPEEVNPVIDCFTKTCAGDLLGLPGCLLDKCAKLIDALNPKCKECVIAGVKQDTTGLLTSCLDTANNPGNSTGNTPGQVGSGSALPF